MFGRGEEDEVQSVKCLTRIVGCSSEISPSPALLCRSSSVTCSTSSSFSLGRALNLNSFDKSDYPKDNSFKLFVEGYLF